jgi:aspartate-semialdehyde dehydrogenase
MRSSDQHDPTDATRDARIGVVGATGAVGTVTLRLLAERGYRNVRAFASARSAGTTIPFGDAGLAVEEATPEALSAGDLDLCLFSVGTSASRALVPHAAATGGICVDKSSAYRLVDGYPLVVPEVNGARAIEALERDRIVANPNCCTIPLTCVLAPLHERAGLRRVRVATYQSVSGAGAQRMSRLADEAPAEHDLVMDWSWEGDESDEEAKLRAETRKIMELPDLPVSATCVRVPVMVGHSEAVWVELDDALTPDEAADVLRAAPGVRVLDLPAFPTPAAAAGIDEVLVGRIRRDTAAENGLALYLSSDNLRKGAALNAIQIAEVLLGAVTARAAA